MHCLLHRQCIGAASLIVLAKLGWEGEIKVLAHMHSLLYRPPTFHRLARAVSAHGARVASVKLGQFNGLYLEN